MFPPLFLLFLFPGVIFTIITCIHCVASGLAAPMYSIHTIDPQQNLMPQNKKSNTILLYVSRIYTFCNNYIEYERKNGHKHTCTCTPTNQSSSSSCTPMLPYNNYIILLTIFAHQDHIVDLDVVHASDINLAIENIHYTYMWVYSKFNKS